MIYVTQGDPKGIGLETFLKAYSLLPLDQQKNISLICAAENLEKTFSLLPSLGASYHINDKACCYLGQKLAFIKSGVKSVDAFLEGIKLSEASPKSSILITLPSAKEDLVLPSGEKTRGHTDFLEKIFKRELCMTFIHRECRLLLLTDHLPLREVAQKITLKRVIYKVKAAIEGISNYFDDLSSVIFYGINPHAGEGGLLGSEDDVFLAAKEELSKLFPKLSFLGPRSGDTISLDMHPQNLLVSPFHDQGLSSFKTRFKFFGINATLGLPFLRLSVDFGTAKDLFGQDRASYLGLYQLLKLAVQIHMKLAENQRTR